MPGPWPPSFPIFDHETDVAPPALAKVAEELVLETVVVETVAATLVLATVVVELDLEIVAVGTDVEEFVHKTVAEEELFLGNLGE